MRIEERNMLYEMAEQLKASNVALRELIHMALDAKPDSAFSQEHIRIK